MVIDDEVQNKEKIIFPARYENIVRVEHLKRYWAAKTLIGFDHK